jgi:transcriptional regulator GlxA family with amidase domain
MTDRSPDHRLQIGVLLFPGFEPLDAIGPAQVFWALDYAGHMSDPVVPDAAVHLVAVGDGPVHGSHGLTVLPTISATDCPDLDVLVVSGGAGVELRATDDATLSFVRRQAACAGIVASRGRARARTVDRPECRRATARTVAMLRSFRTDLRGVYRALATTSAWRPG